jgi:hypothetical protein
MSATPFNDAVLTNSPADFNATQQENAALVRLVETEQHLPSPVKNISLTSLTDMNASTPKIESCAVRMKV